MSGPTPARPPRRGPPGCPPRGRGPWAREAGRFPHPPPAAGRDRSHTFPRPHHFPFCVCARCQTLHSPVGKAWPARHSCSRTKGIGRQASCAGPPSWPTVSVGQLSRGPHRHANAARLPVGTDRVRRSRAGACPAAHGATRPSQCRPRLPSGAYLQFWSQRHLPRMSVGLHMPRVPLHSYPLHRRRHAARVPAHALHLGRLRPITPRKPVAGRVNSWAQSST